MRPIDLRSDTVTRPTPEMRRAMAEAEVGDDVWGDDPTVIELEREVAAMLGKEAAVYVPSGAMGNQICVRSHTRPGDEMLIHERAHVVVHEQGGAAVLSGVQTRTLAGAGGVLEIDLLERELRDPADPHHARQSLVCVENTVGEMGGLVHPQEAVERVAGWAHAHEMALHMDGARLWNAAVASDRPPAELAAPADSLSVCFSKGLGAPVGSAVVGNAGFIAVARRNRKLFGGGMRQAGIIAAGALHALRHHVGRLADDHAHARLLAERLAGAGRLRIDPARVQTNIVLGTVADGTPAPDLVGELGAAGVLCASLDAETVRFVTHLDVSRDDVEAAIERAGAVLT
ncbi:MAG TPA: GntG family PLP-dependent aldolase [Gaiellales bacterium]|nr:GntG family PLP-dependent aldolase [Gaiellales bacterium]